MPSPWKRACDKSDWTPDFIVPQDRPGSKLLARTGGARLESFVNFLRDEQRRSRTRVERELLAEIIREPAKTLEIIG